MRSIPQAAIDFIKQHEACKLTGYPDSGGLATVGYGHTGPGVKVGLTIPQSLADLYLSGDLDVAAKRLAAALQEPVLLDLTDNQYAALLSFVFNLGCQPQWTIWKLLNARDYDHVPGEMMRFVYCKGAKVQGLVNRRAAEVQLWSTAEPGSVPDVPSSAATRSADTPPLPAKPSSVKAHAVTMACAAGAWCAQQSSTVKGWADGLAAFTGAPIIAHLSQVLLTAAGLAALAGFVAALLKNRQAAQ